VLNNDLEKIKEIDSYSDIKMYNFVLNNYKKIKLFENHSHPREYFYFIMVEKILKKLNIPIQNIKTHNRCSDSYYPIHPEVNKILDLDFDTNMICTNIQVSLLEFYCLNSKLLLKMKTIIEHLPENDKRNFSNIKNNLLLKAKDIIDTY